VERIVKVREIVSRSRDWGKRGTKRIARKGCERREKTSYLVFDLGGMGPSALELVCLITSNANNQSMLSPTLTLLGEGRTSVIVRRFVGRGEDMRFW